MQPPRAHTFKRPSKQNRAYAFALVLARNAKRAEVGFLKLAVADHFAVLRAWLAGDSYEYLIRFENAPGQIPQVRARNAHPVGGHIGLQKFHERKKILTSISPHFYTTLNEALSFIVLIVASFGLPAFSAVTHTNFAHVSPYWLIGSYFFITVAELFLSPIGLSFVSKVAPPKMKGAMMGAWFAAQATGSYLSGFVGRFFAEWQLWQFFLLLVATSLLAGLIVLSSLGRLKRSSA